MNIELTAEIRFRCPCCQKLYCSDTAAFSSNKMQPSEFECFSCAQSFFLYQNKSIETGLFQTEKSTQASFSKCPKCQFLKPQKHDECPNCQTLESKFKNIQKLESANLLEVDQAWSVVLSDLTNDKYHQIFLNLAQNQMALNFASQKYMDLKKTMGADPLIEKYLKQIELRLEKMVQARFESEKKDDVLNRFKNINSKDIFKAVSLLGTVVLIYNKIHPTFPNLTGLIVAATVLSYGLWFMSLNSSKI